MEVAGCCESGDVLLVDGGVALFEGLDVEFFEGGGGRAEEVDYFLLLLKLLLHLIPTLTPHPLLLIQPILQLTNLPPLLRQIPMRHHHILIILRQYLL